jgi:hypothetical protein
VRHLSKPLCEARRSWRFAQNRDANPRIPARLPVNGCARVGHAPDHFLKIWNDFAFEIQQPTFKGCRLSNALCWIACECFLILNTYRVIGTILTLAGRADRIAVHGDREGLLRPGPSGLGLVSRPASLTGWET